MEINVATDFRTGEKRVVSTATVPAEELKHHGGVKVFDDGRKCVYALNPPQVRLLNVSSDLLETKVNQ